MLLSPVTIKGNTVGSRSNTELAYIAGFLDGDGSLMLQLKKRSDGKHKWRFMATICLYQDSRHDEPLVWIRNVIGVGYLSRRNDGITELRIQGYRLVTEVIRCLQPYIRFKVKQAKILLNALDILANHKADTLTELQLRLLVDHVVAIQNNNYSSTRKRTKQELCAVLGLTP